MATTATASLFIAWHIAEFVRVAHEHRHLHIAAVGQQKNRQLRDLACLAEHQHAIQASCSLKKATNFSTAALTYCGTS